MIAQKQIVFDRWAPDAPAYGEPYFQYVENAIPTTRGYTPARGFVRLNTNGGGSIQFAGPVRGGCVARDVNVAAVPSAGVTRLYTWAGEFNAIADKSRAAAYTDDGTPWRYASFGNIVLACNKNNATQYRDETTANLFADTPTAPKFAMMTTVAPNFIIGAGYDDGSGFVEDGVWWCGLANHLTWTPDPATQAGNLRILGAPGPITAIRALGPYVIVFKARSMVKMRFAGPPLGWVVERIPGNAGALSQESVVDYGDGLAFRGPDGFFAYDGGQVRAIDNDIHTWYNSRSAYNAAEIAHGQFDPENSCVWWWFRPDVNQSDAIVPGTDFVSPKEAVLWNIKTGQWGRVVVVETVSAAVQIRRMTMPLEVLRRVGFPSWDIFQSGMIPRIGYNMLIVSGPEKPPGNNSEPFPNVLYAVESQGNYVTGLYFKPMTLGTARVGNPFNATQWSRIWSGTEGRDYSVSDPSITVATVVRLWNKPGRKDLVQIAPAAGTDVLSVDINKSSKWIEANLTYTVGDGLYASAPDGFNKDRLYVRSIVLQSSPAGRV